MYTIWRILAIIGICLVSTFAWLTLAQVTHERSSTQEYKLAGQVTSLWGVTQFQRAPTVSAGGQPLLPTATTARADIHLDQRLKGMLWYALYDVTFDGAWTYVYEGKEAQALQIGFEFPVAGGVYDDFQLRVDGRDMAHGLRPEKGKTATSVAVRPGQTVTLQIHYKSRGRDRWSFDPSPEGVTSLENFTLTLACDFHDIDYPENSMAPSRRQRTPEGWILTWNFAHVLTGSHMGLIMPVPIQPGELATALATSAPVSLVLFFIVLFVLSVRFQLDIHPLNYLGMAAAFFAFHLLFSYSVDHIHLGLAFVLASAASIFLVVSYLRLVVSPRFAYRRVALAQLVYQVGFSIAHFFSGYTGLTISVLATLTLFLVMQMTGRVRWTEVLTRKPALEPARAHPGTL